MKKYMAVLAALVIGLSSSSLEMTAMAAQMEDDPGSSISDVKEEEPDANEKEAADGESEMSELTSLQIPQKLGVVLDPWELDGKTQIYSEEYTIQNAGEAPGTLVLSFACKPQENSGVTVRAENEGLHDDESKSLYMKMVFGNGDELILSEEVSEYEIEMVPGEELSVCFQGELNENAADPWKNGDIEVEGVYSWKTEGEASVEEKADAADDPLEEGKEKVQKDGVEKQEPVEGEETPEDKDSLTGEDSQEEDKESGSDNLQDKKDSQENGEGEHREIVDLNEPQEWKVVLDSWEESENEEIVFAQYLLRNSGETVGRLVLEDIEWENQEKGNEKADITGQEGIADDDSHKPYSVGAEMVLENGEKAALTQESIGYEVEVKPGEDISVDFMGEENQMSEWKEGAVKMTATYSWNID